MTQSPHSILVVEDDDRLAHMMATSLNKAGYEAQVETNGTAAVERIRRDAPDWAPFLYRKSIKGGETPNFRGFCTKLLSTGTLKIEQAT